MQLPTGSIRELRRALHDAHLGWTESYTWLIALPSLSALVLCSCATLPARPTETITITEKSPYPICIGYCVDFSVSIGSDGQVVSHAHRLFPGDYRYRITPQMAADMSANLDGLRPSRPQAILPCSRDPSRNLGFSPESLSNEPELVIKWSGSSESQLVRCDIDAVTGQALEKALNSLGLFIGIPKSVMNQAGK
jgi:hypothetical protein